MAAAQKLGLDRPPPNPPGHQAKWAARVAVLYARGDTAAADAMRDDGIGLRAGVEGL